MLAAIRDKATLRDQSGKVMGNQENSLYLVKNHVPDLILKISHFVVNRINPHTMNLFKLVPFALEFPGCNDMSSFK